MLVVNALSQLYATVAFVTWKPKLVTAPKQAILAVTTLSAILILLAEPKLFGHMKLVVNLEEK